uniref:Uncharacterized protein n=1 Tax=Acartia pacifica TaxID=335913 RepID=A0A0U2V8J7_ACAPC|nr:hypothetical protein [Acartia pacifica]ALS04551.1 hypothetical protein [Acartia pacifica]ALS04552.1 hypothetical protein [Acartia pacifica]
MWRLCVWSEEYRIRCGL